MNCDLLRRKGKLLFFIVSISIVSCDLINPDEPIPSKIKLEPFDLQMDPGQGSDRHKITEVWVYANNNFLGIFSPPVEFPYLTETEQTSFSFLPGIRNNGIANDAIIYPMYTPYEIILATTPGSISEVNPVTRYRSNIVISLNADFETNNEFVFNRDTVTASFVTRTMENPFEGEYSGEIVLTEQAYFIEVGHALPLSLPTDGTPTYLEFQYKSETELGIGILGISLDGQSFSNFFYLAKPSENWNMLYIELTDLLKASNFAAYRVLFSAIYPAGTTEPELKIQLDNIKVVHL